MNNPRLSPLAGIEEITTSTTLPLRRPSRLILTPALDGKLTQTTKVQRPLIRNLHDRAPLRVPRLRTVPSTIHDHLQRRPPIRRKRVRQSRAGGTVLMSSLIGIVGATGDRGRPLRPASRLEKLVLAEDGRAGDVADAARLERASEVGGLRGRAAIERAGGAVARVAWTGEGEPFVVGHGAGDEVGLEPNLQAGGVVGKGRIGRAREAARGSEACERGDV